MRRKGPLASDFVIGGRAVRFRHGVDGGSFQYLLLRLPFCFLPLGELLLRLFRPHKQRGLRQRVRPFAGRLQTGYSGNNFILLPHFRFQKSVDNILVLFALERARHVKQHPART